MTSKVKAERDLPRQLHLLYQRERTIHAARQGRPARRSVHPHKASGARDDIWDRLARFCASRAIDAVAYLLWHFDRALVGKAPEPTQLLNSRWADEYLAELTQQKPEIEIAFRVQQQVARTHIQLAQHLGQRSAPDAWAAVLLDESLSLSALYRYCLACSIGGERFLNIARIYEGDATRQYRRNPSAYAAIWKQWIPRSFRDQLP